MFLGGTRRVEECIYGLFLYQNQVGNLGQKKILQETHQHLYYQLESSYTTVQVAGKQTHKHVRSNVVPLAKGGPPNKTTKKWEPSTFTGKVFPNLKRFIERTFHLIAIKMQMNVLCNY